MSKYHISPSTGNPNKCTAKPGNCPHGSDSEHYESKEAARAAYEVKMGSGVTEEGVSEPSPFKVEETTSKGNTYSELVKQEDGAHLQMVNGHTLKIHKKNAYGHRVSLNGETAGWIAPLKGKWDVTYSDGGNGRPEARSADALAAILKKKLPRAKKETLAPTPAAGYDPGSESELNYLRDFPSTKAMTVGRLRRLSSEDLARVYSNLERSMLSAHYSSEVQADRSAQDRVKKVLGERNREVEVDQWGKLRAGEDFSDASTYRLTEDYRVPCDDQHQARIARDGYCRKCGGAY